MTRAPRTRPWRTAARLATGAALALVLTVAPAAAGVWLLAALSPHLAGVGALAARAGGVLALAALPMALVMGFRRRVFCRWMCPVGLLCDGCARLSPMPRRRFGKVPRVGRWLAVASLAGAAVGVPVALWADPLAIFSAAVSVAVGTWTAMAAVGAAGLVGLVGLALLAPGLWCARLCPLGGTQELLADGTALARRFVRRQREAPSAPPSDAARRTLLAAGAGAGIGLLVPRLLRGRRRALRPPGAADEARLAGLCARCGRCVAACPSGIIHRELAAGASLLTPVVRFGPERPTDRYCLEDCNRCGQSCPTGAIARLPLGGKNSRRIGLAVVDVPECLLTADRTCGVCIDVCPRDAVAGIFDRESYTNRIVIDPARCNGCGACVVVCPVNAVRVVPLPPGPNA